MTANPDMKGIEAFIQREIYPKLDAFKKMRVRHLVHNEGYTWRRAVESVGVMVGVKMT